MKEKGFHNNVAFNNKVFDMGSGRKYHIFVTIFMKMKVSIWHER